MEGALAMFFETKMAVFEAMKPDMETLLPIERRRFAELCRRWADLAEPLPPVSGLARTVPIATGVLQELGRGLRSEE
jgi:hypothetical protein